ncbi:MAG: hemerythrin domain-containing protein [Dehalococcoidia bacterium]|nr:hemerythrin domain-containing protein [Dehalococcoidia bacterium]
MPTGLRLEIYTTIHKGWRNRLFQMSTKAGRTDYTDQVSLESLYSGLQSIAAGIRLHHHGMEALFIHPLLSARMPAAVERLDKQHQHVDHLLDNLLLHVDAMRKQAAGFEKRRELGLEFYLAFNRFISFFLIHIDQEEEQIQPALWNLCTAEELETAWQAILNNQTPQEAMENLGMILSSADVDELGNLLAFAKASLPAERFDVGSKYAQSVLDDHDWSTLRDRLGAK